MYDISYLWTGPGGLLITIIVSVIVSVITGQLFPLIVFVFTG